MRYALLIYSAPGAHKDTPLERSRSIDWVAYARAAKDAGILLGAEQLTPADTATSLRMRGEDQLLTDGPFMETKEHLLGFFLVDVPDLDTALEWASKMPTRAYRELGVRSRTELACLLLARGGSRWPPCLAAAGLAHGISTWPPLRWPVRPRHRLRPMCPATDVGKSPKRRGPAVVDAVE